MFVLKQSTVQDVALRIEPNFFLQAILFRSMDLAFGPRITVSDHAEAPHNETGRHREKAGTRTGH